MVGRDGKLDAVYPKRCAQIMRPIFFVLFFAAVMVVADQAMCSNMYVLGEGVFDKYWLIVFGVENCRRPVYWYVAQCTACGGDNSGEVQRAVDLILPFLNTNDCWGQPLRTRPDEPIWDYVPSKKAFLQDLASAKCSASSIDNGSWIERNQTFFIIFVVFVAAFVSPLVAGIVFARRKTLPTAAWILLFFTGGFLGFLLGQCIGRCCCSEKETPRGNGDGGPKFSLKGGFSAYMDNLMRKAELEEREKKRRQNNTIAMVPRSKPLVVVEKEEVSVSISRSSVKGAPPRMYAANGRTSSRENSVSRAESIPEKQTGEPPPLPPVVEEQPVVDEEEGEQKEPEPVVQQQQLVEVETTPATSQPRQQQRNLCEGVLKDCRVM